MTHDEACVAFLGANHWALYARPRDHLAQLCLFHDLLLRAATLGLEPNVWYAFTLWHTAFEGTTEERPQCFGGTPEDAMIAMVHQHVTGELQGEGEQ